MAKIRADMDNNRAVIILAAGKSTRMQSKRSKVLHEIGGQPMLDRVAGLAKSVAATRIICVVGQDNTDVRERAESLGLEIIIQEPQLGTGHAVLCAKSIFEGFIGDIAILYADTPLIRPKTLKSVFSTLENDCGVAVMGFETENPARYGRLVESNGKLEKIVEAKDASEEELQIKFCNSGVLAARSEDLFAALDLVGNDNAYGEYYLTDIVEIIKNKGKTAKAIRADEGEILGVNSREDLAKAENFFQKQQRTYFMQNGVTLKDPDTIWFSWDTKIAPDVVIGPNVVFGAGVEIETGAVIHPFCHIEGAKIGKNAQIGPFARLRPGADLAEKTKVGNFVEVKKSKIGKGSKISHLSYIGDAELGEGVNIGAGTITCNYDGFDKYKTIIEDGAFIGTNSSLVAPVKIGKGSYLGSGGVITKNVPKDSLAIARAKQSIIKNWAKRFRDKKSKNKS